MPAKKARLKIQCTVCKKTNYFTNKSKGKGAVNETKLEMMKFCNSCKKHTKHKESKK